ncbi:MAG: hypothetical protein ABI461_05840 [Polyangiaceae bacterium]
MRKPGRLFFGKKWHVRVLVVAAVVAILALVPRLPHEQTLHVDLGDSAPDVEALTIRWTSSAALKDADEKAGKHGETSIEDWTGEVTFRYEKNKAPRVVQHKARLADGEYVVEIELNAEAGGAVTRKVVALGGGTTTIDVSGSLPHSTMEAEPAPVSVTDSDSGSIVKDGGK